MSCLALRVSSALRLRTPAARVLGTHLPLFNQPTAGARTSPACAAHCSRAASADSACSCAARSSRSAAATSASAMRPLAESACERRRRSGACGVE